MMRNPSSRPENKSNPPSSGELAALLGTSYAAFKKLTVKSTGVSCEWRRYGKKSPWVLKVARGKRTLFYVTPGRGRFEVTVVLGERAVQAALAGRVRKTLHASIIAAKPYVEGRSIRVVVAKPADLADVRELVSVKLKPDQAEP